MLQAATADSAQHSIQRSSTSRTSRTKRVTLQLVGVHVSSQALEQHWALMTGQWKMGGIPCLTECPALRLIARSLLAACFRCCCCSCRRPLSRAADACSSLPAFKANSPRSSPSRERGCTVASHALPLPEMCWRCSAWRHAWLSPSQQPAESKYGISNNKVPSC